jgi:hypothetical protein
LYFVGNVNDDQFRYHLTICPGMKEIVNNALVSNGYATNFILEGEVRFQPRYLVTLPSRFSINNLIFQFM